jgi:hypothetical protein
LSRNLPVTVVNHHNGPHAFDLFDNSAASGDVVRQTLEFLRRRFNPSVVPAAGSAIDS